MKILYITDFYYTVSSGAKTSARAHLKTLQNLYGKDNVVVVALVGTDIPAETEKGHIIIAGTQNRLVLFFNCLRGYSTYLNATGIKRIIGIIQESNVQAIFVDNSIFGRLIKEIKMRFPIIPVLAYYHDVKAKLAKDWMKIVPFYKKPVMNAMLTNERLTAQFSDVNFVLGDREEKLFTEAYGKKPEAQLSVYLDIQLSDRFYKKTYEDRSKILFFGGYYLPNVHGIDWFIKNVYEKISDNVELIVAGRGMDKLRANSYPKGVTIKGYIDDIEELYRDVDIIISPIFEGGGMKVKVAEAMAFGKIIVGSDESYEGYHEKIPDEYWNYLFYRANSSDEFIESIKKALSLEKRRRLFNPEIRKIYDEGFSEKYAENVIGMMINKYVEVNYDDYN